MDDELTLLNTHSLGATLSAHCSGDSLRIDLAHHFGDLHDTPIFTSSCPMRQLGHGVGSQVCGVDAGVFHEDVEARTA